MSIATTPKPPYYAVIFTYEIAVSDTDFEAIAHRMTQLASNFEGFLGAETATENGQSIMVSYWKDTESIMKWRMESEHKAAQDKGKEKWMKAFKVRIAKVERDYGFNN